MTPSVLKASRELNRSALYLLPRVAQGSRHNNMQLLNHSEIAHEDNSDIENTTENPQSTTPEAETNNHVHDEDILIPPSSGDSELEQSYTENEPTLKMLLLRLSSQLLSEEHPNNLVNVCRDNILDGALRAFSRRTFKPEANLSVVFLDNHNQAEGSVDDGGPSREFFRLLMQAMKDSSLFTGQEHKDLALDSRAIEKRHYKAFGVMVAVALVRGGVSPLFFSERLYNKLCGLNVPLSYLEDIRDEDLLNKLSKIREATDVTSARAAIADAAESLSLLGCYRHVTSLEGWDELLQCAINFYVNGQTKEALEQLADGLNTSELMKKHPATFRDVFSSAHTPLKADDLRMLFQPERSTPGGNRWRVEKRVKGFWGDFLFEVEEGAYNLTLENILVFASGADRIPLLGFYNQPTLCFNHEHGRLFPQANTCLVKLKLPIHNTYDDFCNYMVEGIIQAPTFGVA